MNKALSTRTSHLLVFRDSSLRRRRSISRNEMGALLSKWFEWHDSLRAKGILCHCSAIDTPSGTVRRRVGRPALDVPSDQTEPIIGYLVIDAADLQDATAIALGCPGLEHGFEVDIFRSYDPTQSST
jgi:hypothetical protein